MIEAIGGLAFIGILGYIIHKMTSKKETFEQAVQETVKEVKATEAKVEAAATEVKAEVAAIEAKVEAAITEAISVADVNKDGKVDVQDAVAVTKKVKEKAVKNVKKAAEKVRKPKAKKPTA